MLIDFRKGGGETREREREREDEKHLCEKQTSVSSHTLSDQDGTCNLFGIQDNAKAN